MRKKVIFIEKNTQANIYLFDTQLFIQKESVKSFSGNKEIFNSEGATAGLENIYYENIELESIEQESVQLPKSRMSLNFDLKENVQLNFLFFLTGQNLDEYIFDINLSGEGSQANIVGRYIKSAGKDKVLRVLTNQRHLAKNSKSQVLLNGVVLEPGFQYCGKIFVDRNASGVEAIQKNKNIILGKNISVDANPELEILNNDVECRHGCAVGQFDKKSIFYLQSRGLEKKEAIKLLIEGFFDNINFIHKDENFENSFFANFDNIEKLFGKEEKIFIEKLRNKIESICFEESL